ncbi:class I SAM-dependent methyltransferase (plasmid) [Rhizobium sullae]|uniref:Class I SAM-dependent methyltransferase n=1 Tax=Rhizobium sullae TaxID=50338 RepID=A0ABY5XXW7_RHISU|nr:class I SAM-dependent methyltransferase [Rhizobium sullae]UWU19475.1 class I SAM-dependent methyltransferase [Rhizobium sullae]
MINFGHEYIKGHFGSNLALGTQQTIQNQFRFNPRPLIDHIIDCLALSGTEKLLDMGCGNGFILRDVVTRLRNGGSVTAIDIAPAMLKLAQANVNTAWVPVQFVEDDVTKLDPEKYGQFDRVMVNFLFHYITDPEALIGKLRRLVRLGGKLTVAIEAHNSMSKMYSLHFDGMQKAGFPTEFINALPKGRRGKMVLENAERYLAASFDHVEEVPYIDKLVFPAVDDYMRFYSDGHGYCGVKSNAGDWLTDEMTTSLISFVRSSVEADIAKTGAFVLEKKNSVFVCS